MEKKKFDVEFHGTNLFALVPLLLFVVFCILFFVVFKTFDMMHLCMGGYVALIIGSLLSKNWGKYWDAVATGMSSKIMNELALILLIVGMFGKLMTRGGVAQGFVWLGDKIGLSGGGFVAFTFLHRHHVHRLPHPVSLRPAAGRRSRVPGRCHPQRRYFRR